MPVVKMPFLSGPNDYFNINEGVQSSETGPSNSEEAQFQIEKQRREELNFQKSQEPQAEFYINTFSAFLSLVSLIVLFSQPRALRFNFETWVPFVPSVRGTASMALVNNFVTGFEDVCNSKGLQISKIDMETKHDNKTSTYVVMPMAYQKELVPVSLLVIWVLAISAAFQTYRAKHMYFVWSFDNIWAGFALIVVPHVVVHVMLWVRIFTLDIDGLDGAPGKGIKAAFTLSLTLTCLAIIFFPVKYINNGPDFGR